MSLPGPGKDLDEKCASNIHSKHLKSEKAQLSIDKLGDTHTVEGTTRHKRNKTVDMGDGMGESQKH